MSLLGRLEDLSLTDIIQIVYLSRRTGVLEIVNDAGRHTILFRNGLVVNAASPERPDPPLPISDGETIRRHIIAVIAPLLQSGAGEFNFLLSEELGPDDIGYDPDAVIREGGFPPQKILVIEGDKLNPLHELEESMKAGKALLSEAAKESLGGGHFRVAGGLIEVESPESCYRNIVLFERDPLLRVAAKRAFESEQMKTAAFDAVDSAREAISDFFRSTAFFVTFLEVTDESTSLLQFVKRKNPRLPVVMIDRDLDLGRRNDLLHAEADLYLTRPSSARLRPENADEELNRFAGELVLFADHAFAEWEGTIGLDTAAGRRFYEEAQVERIDRTFHLLQQLISELSNPNDISEVTSTILRLAAEYVDRGVLFVIRDDHFAGLGGFGATGDGDDLDARARRLRIPKSEPSILSDVAASGEMHRGKLQRTPANVELIERLGELRPTEVVALPVMHGGRTIGILYGDNAEHRAPIDSVIGLEIFLSQAGYALGNAVEKR